jgi:hypothetical protein
LQALEITHLGPVTRDTGGVRKHERLLLKHVKFSGHGPKIRPLTSLAPAVFSAASLENRLFIKTARCSFLLAKVCLLVQVAVPVH